MSIGFFVSSVGDTDLAKATITQLTKQNPSTLIFLIPLTTTAIDRTKDLEENNLVSRILLKNILQKRDASSKNQISNETLEEISLFINKNKIERVCMGVPSINNEIPFQIADYLEIPCTIAYEYMFKPITHSFWNYIDKLAIKENCDFAVPLKSAKQDILKINSHAKIHEIGHLSIDRSQTTTTIDPKPVRESLLINEKEKELVFISGTTQTIEIDNEFLDALLKEISRNNYPNLQLRMGLHPGIKDPDLYLKTLLQTCENYPQVIDQFKITIRTELEKRLQDRSILSSSFILRSEISGGDAAQIANKIAQAVPGALLNEAALKGKPSYFHEISAIPYLPKTWFSENLATFLAAKPTFPHSRAELGLKDTTPNLLAKLMISKSPCIRIL